jgi:hypothetical protein
MFRLSANRWWAFVLTLCLFTTCCFLFTAQLPSVASADPGSCYMPADEQPPPSLGDPDVPMGPGDGRTGKTGKFGVVRRGAPQVASQNGARPVGDGTPLTSVVMDRVKLFLLGLRSFYLRF